MYQDALRRSGMKRAARELAPMVAHLKGDVEHASDFADLRRRLVARLRDADPKALAMVLRRVQVMSNLAGQAQARNEL